MFTYGVDTDTLLNSSVVDVKLRLVWKIIGQKKKGLGVSTSGDVVQRSGTNKRSGEQRNDSGLETYWESEMSLSVKY